MNKTGYTVHGSSKIQTYTTWKKAKNLVNEHPLLDLFIVEQPISFIEWFFLKIIGF